MILCPSPFPVLKDREFSPYGLTLAFRLTHVASTVLPYLLLLSVWAVQSRLESDPTLRYSIALLAGLLCTLIFHYSGLYGKDFYTLRLWPLRTLGAWSTTLALLWLLLYGLHATAALSLRFILVWLCSSYLLFMLARAILCWTFKQMRTRGHYLQSAVILGRSELALQAAAYINADADVRLGLLGFIDDGSEIPAPNALPIHGPLPPLLGNIRSLTRMIWHEQVQVVLFAVPCSRSLWETYGPAIKYLRQFPVDVALICQVPEFGAANLGQWTAENLVALPIISKPLDGWPQYLKRAEDVLLGSLFLLLSLPLMLLITLAIRLESPGPALFCQMRYGYNKRLIKVYKFRSMHHHLRDPHAHRQTERNDPRVTRIGRFIRKTSLDELPQLFNVLIGNMSLVGPRPHAKSTRAEGLRLQDAVATYRARYRVKPGITGLAQIQGNRGKLATLAQIQRRVELDLKYIDNWSLWLDFIILLKTIPSILLSREAH